MPNYTYHCNCGWQITMNRPINERDLVVHCQECDREMPRDLASPSFKFRGRTVKGGGPDRFTADMLDMRLDELPDSLRTEPVKK